MPRWHKHDFSVEEIVLMLENRGMEILEIVERDWWFGQKVIARKRI